MPSPPILLPRLRPPLGHSKFLKHAWRPPATPEQKEWTVRTLRHLRHSPLLPPDGWLPLTHFARPEHTETALAWTSNDRLRRFETNFHVNYAEDKKSKITVPYIRARAGHSAPDVRISNIRLRLPSAIPFLVYATAPANWLAIERDGIRPRLPPLLVPSPSNPGYIYFAHYMAHLSPPIYFPRASNALQLHIGINVSAAMKAGINFYATNTNQIISTGLPDGSIPHQFFNDVCVVSVKAQQLYDFAEGGDLGDRNSLGKV